MQKWPERLRLGAGIGLMNLNSDLFSSEKTVGVVLSTSQGKSSKRPTTLEGRANLGAAARCATFLVPVEALRWSSIDVAW